MSARKRSDFLQVKQVFFPSLASAEDALLAGAPVCGAEADEEASLLVFLLLLLLVVVVVRLPFRHLPAQV